MELNKTLNSNTESFTIRETINNTNEDIQIKDVVSVRPSVSIENSYVEDDESVIQGIVKVDILYVPVEGLKSVYKLSEEIPFEHRVVVDGITDI